MKISPFSRAAAGAASVLVLGPGALVFTAQAATRATCTAATAGIAVGDSVLDAVNYTGGKSYLQKFLGGPASVSDGNVNRQFGAGTSLIRRYLAKNPKACAVVVALGTNGPVRPSDWDSLMRSLARVPRVVVVNTYTRDYRTEQSWMPRMNKDIAALQRKFRNVRVADWYAKAPSLSSRDLPDGVHPDTRAGAVAWVNTVALALSRK